MKPGDVMQKKNLWEGMGETSGSQQGAKAKVSLKAAFERLFCPPECRRPQLCAIPLFQGAATKKYKFVITSHGKYEKVAMEDGAANGKSGEVTNRRWRSFRGSRVSDQRLWWCVADRFDQKSFIFIIFIILFIS